jgi:ribonucleoside-triphosphate reductase
LITDHVEDIIALQKHYWEWVSKERERQMFTFPVLTASLLYKDGKFLDEDSASFIARVNMKWQDTNWYISDSIDAVASCCRLTSSTQTLKSFSLSLDDAPQLKGMMNSIGGSDLNIGSFKVVTINLPRIALESNGDRKRFIDILKHRVELVQKTLVAVREIIKDRIKQNLLPLYKHNLMLLDRQYGTIGITGVWEAATLMGLTVEDVDGLKYTPEGEAFVDEVLDTIRELAERNSRVYGFTFNIEQVPAEKAAVTLANKDRLLYGEKQPFVMYSNQWVPLFANADVLNRIAYSGRWDRKVSGGAILHINLGEPFGSVDEYFNMVKMIADMGVVYFAFNTKISVCEEGHAFYGERCPVCGKAKKDEYTRIVGYLVPISSFNKTRREYEYPKRVFYSLKEPVSI